MRVSENGCALDVDGQRSQFVGVAVVRVLFDKRTVCFVFVREVEVGPAEDVRAEGLVSCCPPR